MNKNYYESFSDQQKAEFDQQLVLHEAAKSKMTLGIIFSAVGYVFFIVTLGLLFKRIGALFLVLTIVFLSIGIPLLIVGIRRRIQANKVINSLKEAVSNALDADDSVTEFESQEQVTNKSAVSIVESKPTQYAQRQAELNTYQCSKDNNVIKTIAIPEEQRKKTTLASAIYYDTIEIHNNKVVGYENGSRIMTWYYKDYSGIDFVKANMNSQFAQVVFLTGMNSKNRAIGPDFYSTQNANAMKDTNRILFCSGIFSFDDTNAFAKEVADQIRIAFDNFKDNDMPTNVVIGNALSAADEIKKFKELLDSGVITQEEFDAKKRQLLGL